METMETTTILTMGIMEVGITILTEVTEITGMETIGMETTTGTETIGMAIIGTETKTMATKTTGATEMASGEDAITDCNYISY